MDNLLHRLHELQKTKGWLSDDTLREFSASANVPLYQLQAVSSFYPHFRRSPPPRAVVTICRDAACMMNRGQTYITDIKRRLAGSADIEVREVSCLGRCECAPAATVNDVPLLGFSPQEVAEVATGARALPPDEPTATPRRWPTDPYATTAEHYGVLRAAIAKRDESRRTIPGLLKDAGLRGLGGAGFPTGNKWQFVRDAVSDVKYAVVNADESEPGTFKDRVVLEELPHLVIEGLLLGCLVVGATTAVVYIRHEYTRETKAIEREIARVKSLGLLDAMGGLDLSVFVSPGGYILGEETALLEALEGKRGEPRNKPPYPVTHGIFGKPTLVNNVETFSFVPAILTEGAERWKAHGVNGATGWKFLSLCGDVVNPGVYCIPMGTTVAEFIAKEGGGISGGRKLKAFSPGGASAPFLPAASADTPLSFEAMAKAGSMLGSGAVLVVAEGRKLLPIAANMVRFFRNESCGKCVPCRVGSEKAVEALDRALAGEGAEAIAFFPELDEALRLTSICGLGQVVLNPAMSALKHFPEELQSGA